MQAQNLLQRGRMEYVSEDKKVRIRFAKESEAGMILELIQALAEYEKMEDEVVATEDQLRRTLFEDKNAEVLFAESDGNIVGFALFYTTYSTFLGKPGLFLEDLFVKEEERGKGIGGSFFKALDAIAKERQYGRIEWCCLDWNTKSIDFYMHMGAKQLNDRRIYRIKEIS